jgi:hypothetical protein
VILKNKREAPAARSLFCYIACGLSCDVNFQCVARASGRYRLRVLLPECPKGINVEINHDCRRKENSTAVHQQVE